VDVTSREPLVTLKPEPVLTGIQRLRRVAIVPAYNEEAVIGGVVKEIRRADPDLEIVVIDDGSRDGTAATATAFGARVITLPYNLGIGGAMQTGYQFAFERGFDVAVQIDGDGQHDPRDLEQLLSPIFSDDADLVVGSRFSGEKFYRGTFTRRIGIRFFARVVSLIVRQRVTDTTSGFRAVSRRGIRLFAAEYPHDYPEVESTVLAYRHQLRIAEVPVAMRGRVAGHSSITALQSIYYMVKVTLALFITLFRRYPKLTEER
jgi:glycosyltransferase involved in cell wall biosynthesis